MKQNMNAKATIRLIDNVGTFIPYPYKGGLQEYAIELSRRLGISLVMIASSDRSIQIEIEYLSKSFSGKLFILLADIKFFRNPVLLNPNSYRELKKILKEFDIIHFHGPFPLTGDLALRGLNYVFTYHFDIELASSMANAIARVYEGLMLRETLRHAKIITTTSRVFIEESRLLKMFKEKVEVLPLGVDTEELKPTYKYLNRVVFVGRIIPEKGVHVLLNAFEKLSRESPDLELYVVGKPVDTKYYNYLKKLARSKGIEKRIYFTGYLEKKEMLQLIASSSALILPSLTRLDSFGIVILEASALAVPVIVSDVIPGAREFVERAQNGFVVRPGNIDDLTRAIKKLLQSPREYGERGRQYVTAHHDWSVVVDRARDILSRCVLE